MLFSLQLHFRKLIVIDKFAIGLRRLENTFLGEKLVWSDFHVSVSLGIRISMGQFHSKGSLLELPGYTVSNLGSAYWKLLSFEFTEVFFDRFENCFHFFMTNLGNFMVLTAVFSTASTLEKALGIRLFCNWLAKTMGKNVFEGIRIRSTFMVRFSYYQEDFHCNCSFVALPEMKKIDEYETRRPLSTGIFSATRLLQKKYGEGKVRTHDLLAVKAKKIKHQLGFEPRTHNLTQPP